MTLPLIVLSLGLVPLPVPQETPRLVVMVAVDQLIPEQLDRLSGELDGGLGRFWNSGTVLRSASLDYAHTETGPGHATYATGCLPRTHGIVANSFHDRAQGSAVYCVADEEARPVTSDGPGRGASVSPRNLLVPTLGDHLRAAFPAAKVFAISGKDRSAVLMGGASADCVLWWDQGSGGFSSSTHYGDQLADFVLGWNRGWIDVAQGWRWEPCFEGDPARWGTAPDERPGEVPRAGRTTFPYVLEASGRTRDDVARKLAAGVYSTPLVDLFALEVARLAVEALDLGGDGVPDLLAVSLSACDVVGHAFGPYSWEVTDLVLRVDDALGELFDLLDERLGPGAWVASLSADHGVLELPEHLTARGVGARRIPLSELGAMQRAVREAVELEFGSDVRATYNGRGFVLDETALLSAGHDPAQVRATVALVAAESSCVAAAYTLEQLAGEGTSDGWLGLYRDGFRFARSMDVTLRFTPWSLRGMGRGTSHGSPYPYDRRIPLAFLGPGFPAVRKYIRASSTDAVPTLLTALGLDVPDGLDGHSLNSD